jgi:tetratricopeptide (TPR) repeat protein
MTRTWKVILLSLLGACLILAAWIVIREGHTPKDGSEALKRAIELQEAGRYDKAVQVLQTWMKGTSRNSSHDAFFYHQIAMIYIAKAYKKPATINESIREAQLNLEKSLDFLSRRDPEDNSAVLGGIGGAYEIMGDVSDKDKCQLYEKARQAFERELPLTKGDSYTAYGTTIPLEPVRAEIRKHLDEVNKKYSGSGCQLH